VFELSVQSSGPLSAQHAIEAADRRVLETLGSQFLGRASLSQDPTGGYRRVQAVDRRFAALRRPNRRGLTPVASVPLVEVLGEGESQAPR